MQIETPLNDLLRMPIARWLKCKQERRHVLHPFAHLLYFSGWREPVGQLIDLDDKRGKVMTTPEIS